MTSSNMDSDWDNRIKEAVTYHVSLQDYQPYTTRLKNEEAVKTQTIETLFLSFCYERIGLSTINALDLIENNLNLVASDEQVQKVRKELDQCSYNLINYLKNHAEGYDGPLIFTEHGSRMVIYQHVFGISNETMELIYKLSCHYYEQNENKNAKDLLHFITHMAPDVASYWLALGVCYQTDRYYKEAIEYYNMAKMLNKENPNSYIYSAECHHKLNNGKEAIEEIDYADTIIQKMPVKQQEIVPELDAFRSLLYTVYKK